MSASRRFRFALGMLLLAVHVEAQTPVSAKHEIYTAKTVNLSAGAGQDLKIDIFRWSTEEERTAVLNAAKQTDEKALSLAIQKAPSFGTIWTNESLGYVIRYAYTDMLPNSGERIVIITDGRLGSWSGQPWKPARPSEGPDYSFTLIELRVGRAGGEGKMSLTSKIVADDAGKTLTLNGFESAPVLLRPVKHDTEHQK